MACRLQPRLRDSRYEGEVANESLIRERVVHSDPVQAELGCDGVDLLESHMHSSLLSVIVHWVDEEDAFARPRNFFPAVDVDEDFASGCKHPVEVIVATLALVLRRTSNGVDEWDVWSD